MLIYNVLKLKYKGDLKRALMICSECGKEYSDKAIACPNCGCPTTNGQKNSYGIKCPNCGSNNINIQREEVSSISTSKTRYKEKGDGCLYWLFIGWWFWMFKIVFIPFTIFFGKNNNSKGTLNTVTENKTIKKKIAICQNCGNHWDI